MAKMNPAVIDEGTKSSAERKLFRLFQAMPDTDNWTVLHSLRLAKMEYQSQGETDFVVVIPGSGVFALEVKGGAISCENDKWYSTDRYGIDNPIKNPINEASDGMQAVIDHVNAYGKLSEARFTVFGFGVVFPDTSWHGLVRSTEVADEQVADYDDCLSSDRLKQYCLKLAAYWRKRRVNQRFILPTPAQCEELVQMMRPSFKGRISLKSKILTIENRIIELTENQRDVVDTISENDRVLVLGDAGTGKTVTATDIVRGYAEQGARVGFFCYNRQLAAYLKHYVGDYPSLECGSFTEFMESVLQKADKMPVIEEDPEARSRYYKELLPQLFMEAFLELDLPLFDVLVLDEAQDLMTANYLDAMDLILSGGLKDGRWYFFMDADRQNIYQSGTNEKDVFELLRSMGASFTKQRLRDNCRNSVAIIEKIDSIFGIQTRHKPHEQRGEEVKIRSYRNTRDQAKTLQNVLEEIRADLVEPSQIVILSPRRFDKSIASQLEGIPITIDPVNRNNEILFSTIQGFKGLESPVVILTDLWDLSDELKRDILYVGMTRAKGALYLLAKENVAKELW